MEPARSASRESTRGDTVAVAFIGSVIRSEEEASHRQFSQALKMFQRSMLRRLAAENFQIDTVFSVRPVLHFPAQPQILCRGSVSHTDDGFRLVQIPFVNLLALKQLTASLPLAVAIVAWAIRQRARKRLLLAHNLYPAPAPLLVMLARLTRTPLVAVIADIHVPGSGSRKDTLLSRMFYQSQIRSIPYLHGAVVLTRRMVDDFAPGLPHLVMEGAVPDEVADLPPPGPVSRSRFIIMYSGTLTPTKGTPLLLDAFRLLQGEDFELWITGDGESAPAVEAAAKHDPRIRFLGFLPYSEVTRLARNATVLVNTHRSTSASAAYQFPSKLLEYMASGRPVISTSTPGVDRGFSDHLIVLPEETPEALANAIRSLAEQRPEQLDAMGMRAREFVLSEKTWRRQGERVSAFLRQVLGTEAEAADGRPEGDRK